MCQLGEVGGGKSSGPCYPRILKTLLSRDLETLLSKVPCSELHAALMERTHWTYCGLVLWSEAAPCLSWARTVSDCLIIHHHHKWPQDESHTPSSWSKTCQVGVTSNRDPNTQLNKGGYNNHTKRHQQSNSRCLGSITRTQIIGKKTTY